ncbi:MAG: hypothetical protein LBC42_01080 [Puniceicoccales bacterium]|jgi:cell division protein FtsB|nr:hypothetical protein [Puniceicoccales bacterium]
MASGRKVWRLSHAGARLMYVLAILSLGAISGGFGRIWYGQQSIRVGHELSALEAENVRLTRRCALLRARIANLHTPTYLQKYASASLSQPSREHLVIVSQGELRNVYERTAQTNIGRDLAGEILTIQ